MLVTCLVIEVIFKFEVRRQIQRPYIIRMLYYIGPISSTFLTNIFSGTKSNIMMKLIGEVGNSDEMVITNSGGTIARRSQQDQFDIAHKGYN